MSFCKGEKYLSDLAAYRGMTLEESRDLIANYQDIHGLPAVKSECGEVRAATFKGCSGCVRHRDVG